MTMTKFKKAIREAMVKYSIDVHDAAKIAVNNYPEYSETISKATIKITQEDMGIA